MSLVDLGLPAGEPRTAATAEAVLHWLTSKGHRTGVRVVAGLTRRCASQEGNAPAVCSRLGLAADPRVRLLAQSLVKWQWPDGGWTATSPEARRSSYWHYDLLQGRTMLARAGALPDPRANDALDLPSGKRRSDGLWHYEAAPHWKGRSSLCEVGDWGRTGPAQMITLNALREMRRAGRLGIGL